MKKRNSFLGNYQFLSTSNSYNRAIIALPNGKIIEGNVDSWMDFPNNDQIQVVIDGTTYLVHSANVVLIQDKE